MGHPLYTGEEIVARGKILYQQQIQSRLEADADGKYLVIDTLSGDYELDAEDIVAMKRAREKHPDGAFYVMRIGYPALGRLGAGIMRRTA